MSVPNENTTNLPKDTTNQPYVGLWDRINSVYKAITGNASGSLVQVNQKGTPTITKITSSGLVLAANTDRLIALIYNNGTDTAYLDHANPATTSSTPIPVGCQFCDNDGNAAWYAIPKSGTLDLRVTEYS
jgi:hypothetical protein